MPTTDERLTKLEIESQLCTKRLDSMEVDIKDLKELNLTIKELAINMANMSEEQKETNARLKALEGVPAEKWQLMNKQAITATVSAIVGALIAGFLSLI